VEAQGDDLTNETAVLADILKCSTELPVWQRDALLRLCSQTKLGAADLAALVAICKGEAEGVPLDVSHVRNPAASHAAVKLGVL
jgi:hypothetical protein